MTLTKQLVSLINYGVQWPYIEYFLRKNKLISDEYSRLDIINTVHYIWANNNTVSKKEQNFVFLPCSKVNIRDKYIYIHGLIHDALPEIVLNEDFKKSVANALRNRTVLCEDGFTEWIANSKSFNEIEYFQFNINKPLPNRTFNIYKLNITNEEIRAMKTVSDFIPIRNKLLQSYFPEPLGINSHFYIKGINTMEDCEYISSLSIRRYIYEANEIMNNISTLKSKGLHVVVGCRHERPLVYLLSNQSLLEKYAKRI